jgi:hypothetical protein
VAHEHFSLTGRAAGHSANIGSSLVLSAPFRARAAHIMQFRLICVEYSSPQLSYDFREFVEHGLAPILSLFIGSRFGERQTVACPIFYTYLHESFFENCSAGNTGCLETTT